jgi:hypothetical protein
MPGGNEMSTEVSLAEIKGDIKRIFDIHERYKDDNRIVNDRLNTHSSRITAVESRIHAVRGAYLAVASFVAVLSAIIGFYLRSKGV